MAAYLGAMPDGGRPAGAVRAQTGVDPAGGGQLGALPRAEAGALADPPPWQAPGQPLPAATRAFFEPRFGQDFSAVRVHSDPAAAHLARVLGAHAYTVGQHVLFAAGQFAPTTPAGRRLLAHELTHVVQQRAGGPRIQRQPADPAEIQMPPAWAFALDPGKRTDRGYARRLARADGARIRKAGSLSAQDREEINAKLDFFQGEAWRIYSGLIRPALVAVTQEEIQMSGDTPDPATTGLQPLDLTNQFHRQRQLPEYIDNDIKEMNYWTAELARIHYRDGSRYDLGLVPRWMKPPVVEVDCHIPAADFIPYEDATTQRLGFLVKSELANNAPRNMPYGELLRTYARYLGFQRDAPSGRLIPSHINQLTTPTLCGLLLDSERRYMEQVDLAVRIGLGGTKAMAGYAGAGGFLKAPGVARGLGLGARTTSRLVLSPTARALANEMDRLLANGGTKTITTAEGVVLKDVAVVRQGSVLTVRRFEINIPLGPGQPLRSQGLGSRTAVEFERAATEIGRQAGVKTIQVNVGVVINPGWRAFLEARGYVYQAATGDWVKVVKL